MTEIYWSPRLVEAYLEEAADTMRRLPGPRVPAFHNSWPEVLQEAWAVDGFAEGPTRLGPATPRAVSQMEETLLWLRWLHTDDLRLVWLRANRCPWKVIAERFGINRSTAWRRWSYALVVIASRLGNHSNSAQRRSRR
jgi:hypothetical protein